MDNKLMNTVVIILVVVVLAIFANFGFKSYISNKYFGFPELQKYPQMLKLMQDNSKFTLFCTNNKDFCNSILSYLGKHPNPSAQERIFSSHVRAHSQVIYMLERNAGIRKYCMNSTDNCLKVLDYMNNNPEKADELYGSLEQGQVLGKFMREMHGTAN